MPRDLEFCTNVRNLCDVPPRVVEVRSKGNIATLPARPAEWCCCLGISRCWLLYEREPRCSWLRIVDEHFSCTQTRRGSRILRGFGGVPKTGEKIIDAGSWALERLSPVSRVPWYPDLGDLKICANSASMQLPACGFLVNLTSRRNLGWDAGASREHPRGRRDTVSKIFVQQSL